MPERYKNYINGKWVEPKTGKYFVSRNPANIDDIIGEFPASEPEDVNEAVEAAKKAFRKWSIFPPPRRAELLFKAGELLVKRKEEYAREVTREMGKILKEGRGDVQEAIDTAYLHAGEGRRLFGFTTTSELPNKTAFAIRNPVGVCGLITPWNFPMAIPSWKLFPALVAGNTVVFKPASDTPYCALLLVKIFEEVGIPPGVVNFVTGGGGTVGTAIVRHKDVKVISFTGSSDVGRGINEIGGRMLKRVSCELGGKNAIIVMDDANIEIAVDGALWGAFGTTGQRCTATSRIILHRKIKDEFMNKFLARTKALKIGNGLDETVEMGPLVSEAQLKTVDNYVQIGKQEGAELIYGGYRLTGGLYNKGYFYAPTIFDNVKPHMRIAKEEIFGPVVSIFTIDSLEEAIEVHNNTDYGLSGSIYTADVNRAFTAIRDLEIGVVYVNAPTIGAESHLPFGGFKDTGNGHREGAFTIYDVFTEWKTVFVDYSGRLQKAQIDIVTLEK